MAEIEVETKKIGGSVGVIIPKEIIEQEEIKVNEKVRIEIRKAPTIGEFFGALKGWKKPTAEIMKEIKKGWKEKKFSATPMH